MLEWSGEVSDVPEVWALISQAQDDGHILKEIFADVSPWDERKTKPRGLPVRTPSQSRRDQRVLGRRLPRRERIGVAIAIDNEQVTTSTDNQIRRHVEWPDTWLDRAIVDVIDTGGRCGPGGADSPQPLLVGSILTMC